MFGLQSYRCLRRQKWLRTFSLLRERHESSGTVNCLQHSQVSCAQVNFSTSATDELHNVKQLVTENSQSFKDSRDAGEENLEKQHSEDSSNFYDILLPDSRQVAGKTKLKRFTWQLDNYFETVQQAKKSNKSVKLSEILPKGFHRIVAQSMNPDSPPFLRGKCLRLLLTDDEDHGFTTKLLTHTLEAPNLIPLDTLIDIVLRLSLSKPTELRTKARKGLVVHIVNDRWLEIGHKYIVSVMYQLDDLFDMKVIAQEMRTTHKATKMVEKENARNRHEDSASPTADSDSINVQIINLERCILDEVEELKPKDLVRVLTLMAKWRSRNETLLDAVTHRLCSANLSDFHYVQLTNVLFACSTLTIHNRSLLDKVSKQLSSLPPLSPSLAISVLSCLSRLKWYNADFVSNYLAYIMQHVSELKGQEACNVLMSVANLYALSEVEQHRTVITALENHALSCKLSNVDIVNVFWSLAILQSLDKDKVGSVLQDSFVQHFHDTNKFQNRSCRQKLQQISTAAKLELSSYEGPYYEVDTFNDSCNVEEISKAEKELTSLLHNALNKFVIVSSYVKERERLPGGYMADALMCSDADGNLKPLSDLEKESSGKKLHRLAIKVIPFKGVISPLQTPSGIYQMESQHLKAMGYTPVLIFFSDLDSHKSVLEHVNAIQNCIKTSVKSASQA